jgi:hypothetical protein
MTDAEPIDDIVHLTASARYSRLRSYFRAP